MNPKVGVSATVRCAMRHGGRWAAMLLLLIAVLAAGAWAAPLTPRAGVGEPLAAPEAQGPKPGASAEPLATAITPLAGDQLRPQAGYSHATDRYLAVWEDVLSSTDHDIKARLVGSDGAPIGGHFNIIFTNTFQADPDVACHLTGDECLVVWEHEWSSTDHDIYAQRVSTDGTLVGGVTLVASSTAYERRPAVVYNPVRDHYLVVYERRSGSDEFAQYDIYAQRVDGGGIRVGDAIVVANTIREEQNPAVALAADYLVVWQGQQDPGANWGIYGQRVAGAGTLVDSRISISTWEGDQILPRVAHNSQESNALVVWEDHHWGAANGWDIYGQLVNDGGSLRGNPFTVSGNDAANRLAPDLAYNAANRSYLVVWELEYTVSDHDVWQRRVAYDGSRPEEEALLSRLGSHEKAPAVAQGNAFGAKLLALWEDYRDYASQGVNIYGELLTMAVPALSGHVYSGNSGDTSTPLAGVTVELYCSSGTGSLGTRIGTTTTDAQGAYLHPVVGECEVYHLLETDLEGYVSVDASSPGGEEVSSNQIYYVHPLAGKVLTDNNFWDAPQGPDDSLPPGNWTAFTPAGWVNTQTPNCTVKVEDGGTGLDVTTARYAFSRDGGITWSGWQAAACTGWSGTTQPQTITSVAVPFGQDSGAADLNRCKFTISDVAGNPGESGVYLVRIDTVPPQNPSSITCPNHPAGAWSAQSQVTCQWSGATDDRSGVDGYSLDWDHIASTVPALPVETADSQVSIPLGDSSGWYLHVRTVDEAGNGAAGAAHYGPIQIDTTPPSAWLTAPAPGASDSATLNVSWAGTDGPSGVASYDVQTSTDGTTWSDWRVATPAQSASFTGQRGQTHRFRVRARDLAGNLGAWSSTLAVEIGVTVTVRVENEQGAPLSDAEVYLNGGYQGHTFASGTMQLYHILLGDRLAARYVVDHHNANKYWHDWVYGGAGNWSYRTYLTNVSFDNAGNPQMHTVTNTGTAQVLRVRRDNPLIGFYVLVSVEWDANDAYLTQLRTGLESASAYLYDLSDGQMMFQVIDIWDNGAHWNDADIRIHASNQVWPNASVGGIWKGQDKHVYMGRYFSGNSSNWGNWTQSNGFRTFVHEWGHYGLDLFDEYLNAKGGKDGQGCTTDRGTTAEAERACFMDSQFVTTEACSTLPLHPHNTNTAQHAQHGGPCWDTIIAGYNDDVGTPAWLLEQPPDRGSIMNGPTSIAVPGWAVGRVINDAAGACPPFDTEWVYDDGSPALHVDTWVDHGSIQLYQGRTVTNTLGTAGILTLMGARPGDTVRLQKGCGPGCSISGSWTVSCGGAAVAATAAAPLILTPDPFALEVSTRPQDGGSTIEITVRASASLAAAPEVTVWQAGVAEPDTPAMAWDDGVYRGTANLDLGLDPRGQVLARATDPQGHEVTVLAAFVVERASDEELTWVKSDDGRMDLFLPPGSLPGEPAVSILPAAQMGEAQGGLAVVGGPYEVSVSSGVTTLAEPATVNIYYDLALAAGVDEASLRIHHWDADAGQWVSDGGAVDLGRHFASTQVGQLGIFAVAGERALPAYLPMVLRGAP